MYQTRVTPNTKSNTIQTQRVTNPIGREVPSYNNVETKQDIQYRIVTSIMFWGLGIIAVTIFYRALSSLML